MVIQALSDQHGLLPEVPPCDLLLIAGDVCGIDGHLPHHQRNWLRGPFSEWLDGIDASHKVGIAGNHDFVLQREPWLARKLPWSYLCDGGLMVNGLKLWGSPWIPLLEQWAFYAPPRVLGEKWAAIPEDTDILVTHTPPRGLLDLVAPKALKQRAGCGLLAKRLRQIRPRVHVFGHVHESHGSFEAQTRSFNVSVVDEFYESRWGPTEIVIDE